MPGIFTRDSLRIELANLWRIAWPLLIAQLAQMGTGVVDTIMAGHYSDQDLAAIAIGFNIWLPVALILIGFLFATSTIVAQDFGANRIEKIRRQLPQSLWVAVFAGVTLAPLVFFSEPLLSLLNLDPDTQEKAAAYTRMVALGIPAAAVFLALRFHTQGLGITKPFAVTAVIGFVANIPLNYAFMYGWWGAPELGAMGCGIATALSMWLSLVLIAGYILLDTSIAVYLPRWQPVAPDWQIIREIVVLGTPIGLAYFLEIAVFSMMGFLVATMGDSAMAAHQIAFNIWDVCFIPLLAIGTAMSTRIGHAIGAQDKDKVLLALGAGILSAASLSLLAMTVLFAMPELIVGIYTESHEIRDIAVSLIRLAALFVLMDAAQFIGSSTLRAYKETRFPLITMLVSYYGVTLPLGWWLGMELAQDPTAGTAGLWIAIITGIAVGALMIDVKVWYVLKRPLIDRHTPGNPTGSRG